MILSPKSEISHHHKVTNITMSPTSLSPFLPEINDNINYKHDVDNKFNDNNRIVESFDIIQIHILPLHCLVIQFQIKNSNERLKMILVIPIQLVGFKLYSYRF